MKLKGKRPIILGVALLVILGGLGVWLYRQATMMPKDRLRLQGHMEATETDLAFKVAGKIALIHVDEGDWAKAGQVVAELEAQDLKDQVAQAEARLAATKAEQAKLEAGYRPQEVQEAHANMLRARAELVDRQLDFERYQKLFERRVVAATTRDKYQANYLVAKETHRAAAENYSKMREGFRKEDIDRARADFQQAQASLELARTNLSYATLYAPVNGVILVRPGQPGQVAAVGTTVLTMGDLDNIYFEGYIPETDLAKVKFGQKAVITTDTFPGKEYPAWVSFINSKAEFTPKTVETFKERVTLVYRTKVRANNLNYELKPGMPAEAVIFLEDKK